MPMHDWSRVRSNRYHDFHQSWSVSLRNALNDRLLPEGYFAMVEQRTGGPEPDVVTLQTSSASLTAAEAGGVAVAEAPPRTKLITRSEASSYAKRASRIAIYHPDGFVVSVIEIVSPGNKDSRHAIHSFASKAFDFLRSGVHLLVIDPFLPSTRDPQGIHPLIWDFIHEEPFELPADKQLTLASYTAGYEYVAYVEPIAVGDTLPEMPIFLTQHYYIRCPLEKSYAAAWEMFPAILKKELL